MEQQARPTPHEIRRARADNPGMRERDLADRLAISEAELVAAHCGDMATRIEPRVDELLQRLEGLGEVMALTRNDSAVHEKIGVYDKVVTGGKSALVLGQQIDLRIFTTHWVHGFAVEKRDGQDRRRSFQFFDAAGQAVHKIHLRPASNVEAYQRLVDDLKAQDQSGTIAPLASSSPPGLCATQAAALPAGDVEAQRGALRERWSAMTDVHQFVAILKSLKLTRHQAVAMVGEDFAWPLACDAVPLMMAKSVARKVPIMCFVGNRGCIQIHSGPIANVKRMGPWLNVMDPDFHLHLRTDHIRHVWAVRKPNSEGHVTSIEAYGAGGELIIQFFGARKEGATERGDWRSLVEAMAREGLGPVTTAA